MQISNSLVACYANIQLVHMPTIRELKARDVSEPQTETGRENFACKGIDLSQKFKLIVCVSETMVSNINVSE